MIPGWRQTFGPRLPPQERFPEQHRPRRKHRDQSVVQRSATRPHCNLCTVQSMHFGRRPANRRSRTIGRARPTTEQSREWMTNQLEENYPFDAGPCREIPEKVKLFHESLRDRDFWSSQHLGGSLLRSRLHAENERRVIPSIIQACLIGLRHRAPEFEAATIPRPHNVRFRTTAFPRRP